jgi:hypothetical protein
MVRKAFLAVVLVAPALTVIGVTTTGTWPAFPHGGVSRDAAIRVAQNLTDPGATGLVSAVVRHDVTVPISGEVIHQWVWLVTFRGQWQLMCSGSPDACNPTTEWVAIDYYTGAWIRSEYSYPAGDRPAHQAAFARLDTQSVRTRG